MTPVSSNIGIFMGIKSGTQRIVISMGFGGITIGIVLEVPEDRG